VVTEICHKEHLLDRAAMVAMRAMIARQAADDLGPNGRAAFDDLMDRSCVDRRQHDDAGRA
jgi:hypothetical protein